MGCRLSAQDRAAAKRSQMIERCLLQPEDVEDSQTKDVKLLLLGMPESGQSTILKQLMVIHGQGFSEEQCKQHKTLVHSQAMQSMAAIVQAMAGLNIDFRDQARAQDAQLLLLATGRADEGVMSPELSIAIERLWADSKVQECFRRSREYHLSDSLSYYLNDWERIGQPTYVPTQEDIIRCSRKTMGVTKTRFTFRDCDYTIFDVGGQRPTSHRWVECFTGVTALVFCVALSDYDLALTDGEGRNAMHQSLQLFHHICKNRWLVRTPVILLLNKKDIFEKKIQVNPLAMCFPEYTGLNTYEEAIEYIRGLFESCWNQWNDTADVITHFTCATNTREMQLVFDAITDYIITGTGRYPWVADPHSGYYAFFS